jgi:hypothetical protein
MAPYAGSLGTQHHLCDVRDLEGSQFVPDVNAKIAERDDGSGLSYASHEMRVVSTEATFERDGRFCVAAPLQHKSSASRLKCAERPVLAILLSQRNAEVRCLVGLLAPV